MAMTNDSAPQLAPATGLTAASFADVLADERKQLFGVDMDLAANTPVERLAQVFEQIHKDTRHAARALCLSGGGIRSATFNLGLMQGLARGGFLSTFDYLSTVSGGGYAGAWLSAWAHRMPGGITEVENSIRHGMPSVDSAHGAEVPRVLLRQEPAEISHLRQFSNYLTPRLGWLSGDTWALLATYPRNLLLNWLMIVPLLSAIVCFAWLVVGLSASATTWKFGQPTVAGMSSASIVLNIGWYGLFGGVCLAFPIMLLIGGASGPLHDKRLSRRIEAMTPRLFVVWPIYLGSVLMSCGLISLQRPPKLEDRIVPILPQIASRLPNVLVICLLMTLVSFVALLIRRKHPPLNVLQATKRFASIAAVYVVAAVSTMAVYTLMSVHIPILRDADHHVLLALWLQPAVRLLAVCWFFTIIVGLTGEDTSSDMEEVREWWSRLMGHLLLLAAGHVLVFGICCVAPVALLKTYAALTGVSCTAAISAALGLAIGRSPKTSGENTTTAGWKKAIAKRLPGLIAAVAILTLAMLGATGVVIIIYRTDVWPALVSNLYHQPFGSFDVSDLSAGFSAPAMAKTCLGLLAFGLAWSVPINVNRFSLYGTYRMRLMRAYLGASRGDQRSENGFTGFDGQDNLPLHHLIRPYEIAAGDIQYHVMAEAMDKLSDRLFKAIWKKHIDDFTDGRALLKEIAALPEGSALPEKLKPLAKRMVTVLNLSLENPNLIDYAYGSATSSGEQALTQPRLSHIRASYTYVKAGHSPRLCNRLILEDCLRVQQRTADGETVEVSALPQQASKPFHVVNTALNLVSGEQLAWQERKAQSFTMTPLSCGFGDSYRPSAEFSEGMSLGGAMTISGAAASPNMGYHSSPAVTALMALFNVRLGCWLGNPAAEAQTLMYQIRRESKLARLIAPIETYRLQSPRFALRPIFDEMFGRTTKDNGYVYLSDGGHFENLGLYEMVRRRCKLVVVSDASCDPECQMTDLANAVRKIRIDLGVRIRLHRVNFRLTQGEDRQVRYCTVGEIMYDQTDATSDGSKVMNGLLIYFKPSITGSEPVDVYNYQRESCTFPHESTSDQWFSESQFESYRRLGERAAETVLGVLTDPADPAKVSQLLGNLDWLRERVEAYRESGRPSPAYPETHADLNAVMTRPEISDRSTAVEQS